MSSPEKSPVTVKKEPSTNGGDALTPSSSSSYGSGSGGNKNGLGKTTDQGWQDIPLKCYSEDDIKDRRYHIARFTNKNNVDIIKDFVKPVRLHRKDPRNIQFHLSRKEIDTRKREQQQREAEREKRRQQKAAGMPVDNEEDDEDEEEQNADDSMDGVGANGDRNGEGSAKSSKAGTPEEIDMSQVAPEGKGRSFRKNMFKRKTRQINLMDDEKRKLRYEEYYPWVMEDYEGKNVYVGNYEAGASEQTHVLFAFDKDGFKMIPAEKVYRFNPRNKYATLTLEEAEAKMEKKSSVPRWLMKHMEDKSSLEGDKDYRFRNASPGGASARQLNVPNGANRSRGLRTVSGGAQVNDRDQDHDDLDYDEEFADDEEAPIMDGDEEENKLSEEKLKKEMLKAAHFDGGSDADANDDIDDLFETEKSRKIDKEGKKLRKVLNKTEGGVYDSDDDDEQLNPYVSQSDLESNDESESEITVKQEPDDSAGGLTGEPKPRQFVADNVGDGFVVIKAPVQFLNGFQKGDWLPNGRKRAISVVESPQKKQKIGDGKEKSGSPTPPLTNTDLNDPGPDGSLVTINEVLDIVKGNPLTPKDLLVRLRNRISANKENKQRIISIVKKNLKPENGKLVLKE